MASSGGEAMTRPCSSSSTRRNYSTTSGTAAAVCVVNTWSDERGAALPVCPWPHRLARYRRAVVKRIERQAELITSVREDVGLSLVDLAGAAGIERSTLEAYESGREQPRPEPLQRILVAARTRPSIPLAIYADVIINEAKRFHLENVRVFGSVVRGQDTEHSDIDLLVSPTPDASLFDLGGFAREVEVLTGFEVDLLIDDLEGDEHFAHVLDEAVPL